MSIHQFTYADAQLAAEACSHHILGILSDRLLAGATAAIAISGGETPQLLFEQLAKSYFKWDKVHIFWVDERAVPPMDRQSNFRLADEALLTPAHISKHNVHRIQAELRPDEAVARYEEEIREFFGLAEGELPHFDVIHRGMGPDAHTASLFPGEPMIDDRTGIAGAVYAEKLGQWRITLLPGVLMAARHTVMLIVGTDKAEAVRAVVREPYDPKRYPAQLSSHDGRSVAWFLDDAAARLIR